MWPHMEKNGKEPILSCPVHLVHLFSWLNATPLPKMCVWSSSYLFSFFAFFHVQRWVEQLFSFVTFCPALLHTHAFIHWPEHCSLSHPSNLSSKENGLRKSSFINQVLDFIPFFWTYPKHCSPTWRRHFLNANQILCHFFDSLSVCRSVQCKCVCVCVCVWSRSIDQVTESSVFFCIFFWLVTLLESCSEFKIHPKLLSFLPFNATFTLHFFRFVFTTTTINTQCLNANGISGTCWSCRSFSLVLSLQPECFLQLTKFLVMPHPLIWF